jgi:hypothetical protein
MSKKRLTKQEIFNRVKKAVSNEDKSKSTQKGAQRNSR